MKPATVSVVMTSFNRGTASAAAIESVLAQSYSSIEFIVSDDGSDGETLAVLDAYAKQDDRIQLLSPQRHLGMPGNLNRGILRSTGELVLNVHDDDLLSPDLVSIAVSALTEYPTAMYFFHGYGILGPCREEVDIIRHDIGPLIDGNALIEQHFFTQRFFGSPVWGSAVVRRSSYARAGLFRPEFGMYADVDMWLRLAELGDVAYVSEPLLWLRNERDAPRQWAPSTAADQRILERIFLEARRRHFRSRLPLARELVRHYNFAAQSRVYKAACEIHSRNARHR